VARALQDLPASRDAFGAGRIRWSVLVEITRVATRETEEKWILFACSKSFERLKVEVRDAKRNGRKEPRKGKGGLPDIGVHLDFELTQPEYQVVRKAMQKTSAEISERSGGGRVSPKEVLLFWAERFLATDPSGALEGRTERDGSHYTIVFHMCELCRQATLPTADGPVEVPLEVVERIEGEADKVRIEREEEVRPAKLENSAKPEGQQDSPCCEGDCCPHAHEEECPLPESKPNTETLTRKVLLRDGGMCANPHCGRTLGLNAHHLHFRSAGGATALWNETSVCGSCHSLLHGGLLTVEGDPLTGLTWTPWADRIVLDLGAELGELSQLPPVVLAGSPPESGGEAKAPRPDGGESFHREDLIGGLVTLGFNRRDAVVRLEATIEKLTRELRREPTDSELLREAVRPSRPRVQNVNYRTEKGVGGGPAGTTGAPPA